MNVPVHHQRNTLLTKPKQTLRLKDIFSSSSSSGLSLGKNESFNTEYCTPTFNGQGHIFVLVQHNIGRKELQLLFLCVAAYRNNSYSSFLCCTPFGDIYVCRLQNQTMADTSRITDKILFVFIKQCS